MSEAPLDGLLAHHLVAAEGQVTFKERRIPKDLLRGEWTVVEDPLHERMQNDENVRVVCGLIKLRQLRDRLCALAATLAARVVETESAVTATDPWPSLLAPGLTVAVKVLV